MQLRPAASLTWRVSGRAAQQLASEQQARAEDGHAHVADSQVRGVQERSAPEAAADAVVGVRRSHASRLVGEQGRKRSVVSREAKPALVQSPDLGAGGMPQATLKYPSIW